MLLGPIFEPLKRARTRDGDFSTRWEYQTTLICSRIIGLNPRLINAEWSKSAKESFGGFLTLKLTRSVEFPLSFLRVNIITGAIYIYRKKNFRLETHQFLHSLFEKTSGQRVRQATSHSWLDANPFCFQFEKLAIFLGKF